MSQDLNQRPDLPSDKLMAVTNELARWLPGGDGTAVANWSQAEWEAALWVVYWQNALPWLARRVREAEIVLSEEVNGRLQTPTRPTSASTQP